MILGNDPLLTGDVDLAVVLIVLVKAAITLGVVLLATMLMIWFERKAISGLQNRIGPNRAGPFGILQALADGLKVILKEDLIPDRADRLVFRLAPILTMVPAFITFGLIPLGGDFRDGNGGVIEVFGHKTLMQLANPGAGVLVILAMSSVAVYGVMLAGWSSGSKYPLLGSVRASAQMVSYGLVPFMVFCLAATAELNRPPFDLVEAEQELVGSFQTEYSGFRFAIFYLAEFLNAVTMGAIIVTLFLGGPTGPVPFGPGWAWGVVWFVLKLVAVLYVFVWTRASVPRVRYDQLMDLGWKALNPLSLGWLLLLVAIRVGDDAGWNPAIVVALGALALLLAYGMLSLAFAASRRNRELDALEGVIDRWVTSEVSWSRCASAAERTATPSSTPRTRAASARRSSSNHHGVRAGVSSSGFRSSSNASEGRAKRFGSGGVARSNSHCDLCVEACLTEAITESKLFEFSFTNRADAIYTKAELVVDDQGLPQQLPWEDWSDIEKVAGNSSAWVRATAPGGDRDYVGRVGWSGELGFGVKAPEQGQTAPRPVPTPAPGAEHGQGGHH